LQILRIGWFWHNFKKILGISLINSLVIKFFLQEKQMAIGL